MRGKAWDTIKGVWDTGITPAYAGKSMRFSHASSRERDHPRLCGEKRCLMHRSLSGKGSPPPMRGKGRRTQNAAGQPGITPAYAGKRQASSEQLPSCRDHPRLCGEKRGTGCLERNHEGSPPPMRGKVVVWADRQL